jgi:hypothetical protein
MFLKFQSFRPLLIQRILNDLWRTRLSRSCMIWLHPPPLPPSSDRQHIGRLKKRDNFLMGEEGEEVGGGAKSYDGEKAWVSINYSKLSGLIIWTGSDVLKETFQIRSMECEFIIYINCSETKFLFKKPNLTKTATLFVILQCEANAVQPYIHPTNTHSHLCYFIVPFTENVFSILKMSFLSGFRIRIHLIRIRFRIRIQHFRLNTDPDPGF